MEMVLFRHLQRDKNLLRKIKKRKKEKTKVTKIKTSDVF